MKKKSLLILSLFLFSFQGYSQITYTGCNGVINPPGPHTLSNTGTTNSGGIMRNTFQSASGACSAGNCTYRIIWNDGINPARWEFQLSTNGGSTFPNILYFNTSPSAPNPPDLTLGTWSSPFCGPLATLSGDVQSTTSGSLPIELAQFTTERTKQGVLLDWSTASELNNHGFYIECLAENEKDFVSVDFVEGIGNSSKMQHYTYFDDRIVANTRYYRLRQVDFDGTTSYSDILAVTSGELSSAIKLDVYPKPVQELLMIQLAKLPTGAKTGLLRISDLNGRVVYSKKMTLTDFQKIELTDAQQWSTGLYLVHLQFNNGHTLVEKFSKN